MTSVVDLWDRMELPIRGAIYYANGDSVSLSIGAYPKPFIEMGAHFSLNEFLAENPDDITHIDITKQLPLRQEGFCFIGDGSHGSEGFIAHLDKNKSLKWVLYAEESNPFIGVIEAADGVIVAESSAGFSLRIDVTTPEAAKLLENSQ